MSYRNATLAAIACAVAQVCAVVLLYFVVAPSLADAAGRTRPVPRAVSLSDARSAPSRVMYVRAGRSVDVMRQCGRKRADARGARFFTDVHAYRWNGAPLAAQVWDDTLPGWSWSDTRDPWRDAAGYPRAVGFDGLTVYNGTRRPILFAGWCG